MLAISTVLTGKTRHSSLTKYPACKGLAMAGYQGWFRSPKEGVIYPDEKKIRIDLWQPRNLGLAV